MLIKFCLMFIMVVLTTQTYGQGTFEVKVKQQSKCLWPANDKFTTFDGISTKIFNLQNVPSNCTLNSVNVNCTSNQKHDVKGVLSSDDCFYNSATDSVCVLAMRDEKYDRVYTIKLTVSVTCGDQTKSTMAKWKVIVPVDGRKGCPRLKYKGDDSDKHWNKFWNSNANSTNHHGDDDDHDDDNDKNNNNNGSNTNSVSMNNNAKKKRGGLVAKKKRDDNDHHHNHTSNHTHHDDDDDHGDDNDHKDDDDKNNNNTASGSNTVDANVASGSNSISGDDEDNCDRRKKRGDDCDKGDDNDHDHDDKPDDKIIIGMEDTQGHCSATASGDTSVSALSPRDWCNSTYVNTLVDCLVQAGSASNVDSVNATYKNHKCVIKFSISPALSDGELNSFIGNATGAGCIPTGKKLKFHHHDDDDDDDNDHRKKKRITQLSDIGNYTVTVEQAVAADSHVVMSNCVILVLSMVLMLVFHW